MYSGCTVSQFVDGEKQHCLSNLQAIIINTVVCILCQTQLFSEKRNAVTEFGYGRNCLVQCIIGHGLFWVKGNNDGVVREVPSAPSPFKETQKISEIVWWKVISRRTLAFFTAGEN